MAQLPLSFRAISSRSSDKQQVEADGYDDGMVRSIHKLVAPEDNEVLIKVAAAGVNRPDLLQCAGFYPPPPGVGDVLGLEVSGTVVLVGSSVTRWQIGDQVCALLSAGGYAQYCVADQDSCLPVPQGWGLCEAAALPEVWFTVWSNLIDRGRLAKGETILIHGGSSGIGAAAIQLARWRGARVFTTVGSAAKADFCRGLGAEVTIVYPDQDFVEVIKEHAPKGVDVILDIVGGDYIGRNIACLQREGRLINIAYQKGAKVEVNFLPIMLKRLTITGSTLRIRDKAFKAGIAQALADNIWPCMDRGTIRANVFQSFPLDEAVKAHALMRASTHMGKIILEV